MRDGESRQLRQASTIGGVFIQQQLPTEFEMLYGRRCHTPLNWIEPGEKVIFGPDLVDEAEATIHRIQDNLKVVKSCQESYVNKRCRPLQFEVGDHVYLKVSPIKGVKRFGVKGKLSPRYIRPFPILGRCGTWYISWSYHHHWQGSTTFSMCHN
jgi:hypothetical protein